MINLGLIKISQSFLYAAEPRQKRKHKENCKANCSPFYAHPPLTNINLLLKMGEGQTQCVYFNVYI